MPPPSFNPDRTGRTMRACRSSSQAESFRARTTPKSWDQLVGNVEHSAALLGWGSDVLGFDTSRWTDHGWVHRLRVFVDPADVPRVRAAVKGRPARGVPRLADPLRVGRRARVVSCERRPARRMARTTTGLRRAPRPHDSPVADHSAAAAVRGRRAGRSSGTEPVNWSRCGRRSSGTRTTSGAGSSAASGGASTRRSRSSAEPPRSATGSARASWLHVSHETR